MTFSRILLLVVTITTTLTMNAQINRPSLSPRIVKETQVGMAKVTLDYGQPNKQERQVFGALIPYNRVWRTGANSNTKITFSTDVNLADALVPAGTYGLYTIPDKKEWTVIIHKNPKLWGDSGYDEANDLVRLKVPVIELTEALETLQIYFENYSTNGGDLVIAWENTKIVVPLFVDSDELIYAEIEEKIVNTNEEITAQTYFDAAQFYYLKGKDLETAAEWFDKAIKLRPEAFWFVYYKAELAFSQGQLEVAKENTLICLEASKNSTSSDFGYIAKCTLLLEKIVAKK